MFCPYCGNNCEGSKFCSKCGANLGSTTNNNVTVNVQVNKPVSNIEPKNENVFLGILGALLGSIAGVVIIVLLSQVGFIASVAGLVMAICTLKLYEKFAGTLSKKGIIICIVIMVLMTVLAENIAFTLQVLREVKTYGGSVKFFDVFFNLYKYMGEGVLNTSTYVTNLLMVLGFNVLGAFGLIKGQLNTSKK